MKIIMDDTFFIEVDDRNYTVSEKRMSESGKPYFHRHGYYRNVESALYRIAKLNVLNRHKQLTIDKYLSELRAELQQLNKTVEQAIGR